MDKIKLKEACKDVKYLLKRGYNPNKVVEIVTERYLLTSIEKLIVTRYISGFNNDLKKLKLKDIKNKTILIDGYNILITVNSILKGKFLVKSLDGLVRDLENYRKSETIQELVEAYNIIFKIIEKYAKEIILYLEKNISKSKQLARELERFEKTKTYVIKNVDKELILSYSKHKVILTTDSYILSKIKETLPITNIIYSKYKIGKLFNGKSFI